MIRSLVAVLKRIALIVTSVAIVACGSESKNDESANALALEGVPNTKPLITGTPTLQAAAGVAYEFLPEATDADGDTLTFHIENRPEWATFSPTTGRFAGTPETSSKPIYVGIEISVTDGNETSALPPFDLSVQGTDPAQVPNNPPSISGTPDLTVVAGNSYEFVPQGSDPDGQTILYSVTNLPPWAEFDEFTGRLSGTPTADDIGVFAEILISVSDGVAEAALPPFAIEVTGGTAPTAANKPPNISGTPAEAVAVGQFYSFLPTATDPDGQALSFSVDNKPAWLNFNPNNGRLSGTPSPSDVGQYPGISLSVSDGEATASLAAFSISVIAQNAPPQISGSPATIAETGKFYSFLPAASDPDGDALTFAITNKPAWASFNVSNGRITGTPTISDAGVYSNIVVAVTDGAASVALAPFTLTVQSANRSPTISGSPAPSVTSGSNYNFLPTASDPDGDSLVFSISNKPSWATFNDATGRLTGTPSSSDAGTYSNIRITVSDGQLSASLAAFSIVVEAANRAPTISGAPATSATAGQSYSFTPNASDPDGDTLSFSISNQPAWANFNAGNGQLSGTPPSSDVGTYSNIRITVSDGQLTASLAAFSIVVEAANRAPTISGAPATSATAGQSYSFTPNASDPDGDTLSFSISNKPTWANFNAGNGRLSGTPSSSDVGTYSNIRITVSDGQLSASLTSFSVTVQDVQTGSATLSWTPPTQNEDGSPLTNLAGYKIQYGNNASNLDNVLDIPNPGISSAVVENLSPATWYFAVKAYNDDGVESGLSNVASKAIN